jgi:hypothetical protein
VTLTAPPDSADEMWCGADPRELVKPRRPFGEGWTLVDNQQGRIAKSSPERIRSYVSAGDGSLV